MPSKKRPASKASAQKTRARAPGRRSTRAANAPVGGDFAVADFLRAGPSPSDSSHVPVFLLNPFESTPETLRVAWPETCAACGQWFDFPASAIESVIPLGSEECCASPVPKVALRLKAGHGGLAEMLRSHLSGTLGEAGAAPPASPAARTRTRSFSPVTFEEELCGSDDTEGRARARTRGAGAARDAAALELSGPQWVARFPTSRSVFDTKPPFLDRLSKFHQALVGAGASVSISATLRPPERAYLMHFSSKIARGQINPQQVPPMAGVAIQWFHGNLAASRSAAQQMVTAYGIAFPPALNSRHTQGLAIDMTITWAGTLQIKDATGAVKNIGAPRSGRTNAALHTVGTSYGVIKLVSDPPHWSSDGH